MTDGTEGTGGTAGGEGGKHGQEGDRFKTEQRPDFLPEKFWRENKADVEGLAKSYSELEKRLGSKTEELSQQIRAEMQKDRPADAKSYKLPEIEGIDTKILGDHPLVAWWRDQSFSSGLGQKGFEEGIKTYISDQNKRLEQARSEEIKALGENAEARISAVATWAEKSFKDAELDAVREIATTAAGVSVLEKLMKLGINTGTGGTEGGGSGEQLTLDVLKKMQNDPRYFDPSRRDPAFVKQVEEGYAKLFPKK